MAPQDSAHNREIWEIEGVEAKVGLGEDYGLAAIEKNAVLAMPFYRTR
jgi:hypothetical protein